MKGSILLQDEADSRAFKGKYDEKSNHLRNFDLFHEGHYNILKRAKALGDYLIVGVTSESYDIERGKLNVRDSLLKRIENVRPYRFADEIIIEEYQGQKPSDIIKYKVDLLVLGSDWRGKFDYLKNYCDVVYLERTKNIPAPSCAVREPLTPWV